VDFSIPAVGLNHAKVDGAADVIALSANYRAALPGNHFLTPFAGLTWTFSNLDDFDFFAPGVPGPIGTISPGSNESLVGRVGVQWSYVHQVARSTFLVPFAAASAWHNFRNESDLEIIFGPNFGNTTVDASTAAAKNFRQYDLGLSITDTKLLASAFVKATVREGDMQGPAVSVGGRINF